MDKEKAIELIQATNKTVSRAQIEAMIKNEQTKAAGLLTEEAATYLVLQNFGVAAPITSSILEQRMANMMAEPESDGIPYLKPINVKVGNQVRIEKVVVEEEKILEDDRVIPSKPVVTGVFIVNGVAGEQVKVSINKSTEKKLYQLWGAGWEGKTLMVTGIVTKNIRGQSATWIDWMGLP